MLNRNGMTFCLAALLGCATPAMAGEAHNTLTEAEQAEGWALLFDGKSLDGWRGYFSEPIPAGWRAEDGILLFTPGAEGGDIVTDDQYTNFELAVDWKVGPGGNSGIFYLGRLGMDNIYWGAPEMQVLDDAKHADGQNPLTSAGSVYALYPAPRGVAKPAGEWNRARVKVDDGHVEHWLNGKKIADYELGSPAWQAKVAESKFADWPDYGQARTGYIGLQDHGDPVWFRNIKLRVLD